MKCISLHFRYWNLKKAMAAGSEPEHIRIFLQKLRPYASGLSLCGAGAGGFAVVVLKRSYAIKDLNDILCSLNLDNNVFLRAQEVDIANEGVYVETLSGIEDVPNYLISSCNI